MKPNDHTAHAPEHHIMSLGIYFGVFFALMILTVLTVVAAQIDLGVLNTPIAMAIATAKAAMVILWFMHVIYSSRLTWVTVLGSILWMAVMFVLTFSDYFTRHWSLY